MINKYITIPIKQKWYNMILLKIKGEEYREIKSYYTKRLSNLLGIKEDVLIERLNSGASYNIDVLFRNGYSSDSPSFISNCILRIKEGNVEWGAIKGVKYLTFEIVNINII